MLSNLTHLTLKEKKALHELKEKTLKSHQVVALKIFGSKARGDFRKDSDIDILMVLKKPSLKEEYKIYDLVNKIFFRYGIDLSVKIFSEKEYNYLNNIPSIFMRFIQKEAVNI
ncbi:nucleotidyltransferase domain-containing protein [Candidatus Parcubacteria bacterium]|nr:nucleotidyltransferase domain-containing protein [Candidatus Parcubacteria bacterium]